MTEDPDRSRRPGGSMIVLIAITVAAAIVRYWFAIHAGLSSANDIDGPTYFSGAVQLAHGRLPYRNFAFVQPPAVLLLALPFGVASRVVGTRDAFTAIRVLMPLVGVANVWLAGRRVRHRGLIAVLAGAGGLAVYVPAILSTRTLLLEPWLDLFCLLALTFAFDGTGALATRRRIGIAGIFMGLAVAVKLWAVFPLVVLLACCARSPGRARRTSALAIGTLIGFGVPALPFALLSPSHFVHDVVLSQLARFGRRIPFSWRMGEVLGVTPIGKPHAISMITIVAAFALAAVLLLATARAVVVLGRRPSPLAVCSVLSTVVVFAILMLPGEFPYHYPDFLSPFAAVTLGLTAGTLAERFAVREMFNAILAALVVGATVAVLVNDIPLLEPLRATSYGVIVQQLVPPGACVVTDYTAVTIAGNRFVSTDPSCPVIVDPFGLDLTLDDGNTPVGPGPPTAAVVSFWRNAFERTNWIVLSPTAYARIPLVPSLKAYFHANFSRVGTAGVTVYERTSTLRHRHR